MKNRVKKQALSFAAVMAMILGGGMQLYAADKIADTVYRNGKINTITETVQEAKDVKNAKKVDVVATLNGKIIFVGSEADAKAQGYLDENKVNKIVDLRGKTMLPGFVDGHGHFPGQGTSDLYKVNLNSPLLDGTVDTMDKLIEELRKPFPLAARLSAGTTTIRSLPNSAILPAMIWTRPAPPILSTFRTSPAIWGRPTRSLCKNIM